MARRRKTRRSGGMLRQQPAQTTPMADKGRREDDEVAHVAEGEVVLPANVRTPEFMANVRQHFERMGVPLDRYTVQDTDADQHAARFFAGQQGGQQQGGQQPGGRQGMLPQSNPQTGQQAFNNLPSWGPDQWGAGGPGGTAERQSRSGGSGGSGFPAGRAVEGGIKLGQLGLDAANVTNSSSFLPSGVANAVGMQPITTGAAQASGLTPQAAFAGTAASGGSVAAGAPLMLNPATMFAAPVLGGIMAGVMSKRPPTAAFKKTDDGKLAVDYVDMGDTPGNEGKEELTAYLQAMADDTNARIEAGEAELPDALPQVQIGQDGIKGIWQSDRALADQQQGDNDISPTQGNRVYSNTSVQARPLNPDEILFGSMGGPAVTVEQRSQGDNDFQERAFNSPWQQPRRETKGGFKYGEPVNAETGETLGEFQTRRQQEYAQQVAGSDWRPQRPSQGGGEQAPQRGLLGGGGGLLSTGGSGLIGQEDEDNMNQQTGGQQFYAGKGKKRRGMMPKRNPETGAQAFANEAAWFDPQWYRQQYGDVASAVDSGQFENPYEHFTQYGYREGRGYNPNNPGDPNDRPDWFDPTAYRQNNPDVDQAIRAGDIGGAWEHFQEYGYDEGRDPGRAWSSGADGPGSGGAGNGNGGDASDEVITPTPFGPLPGGGEPLSPVTPGVGGRSGIGSTGGQGTGNGGTGDQGTSRSDLGDTSRFRQPREYESTDLNQLYADTFPWWNEDTGAQQMYAAPSRRRGFLSGSSMNPRSGAQEFNAADLGGNGGSTPAGGNTGFVTESQLQNSYGDYYTEQGDDGNWGVYLTRNGHPNGDQRVAATGSQSRAVELGQSYAGDDSRRTLGPNNSEFTAPDGYDGGANGGSGGTSNGGFTSGNDSVENRLDSLLQSSNPLMVKAGGRARRQANRRGLLNSSMATQAGQSAMVDAALPIAQQDAQTAAQKNLADQQYRQDRAILGAEYQNRSALTAQENAAAMERLQADLGSRERLQAAQDAAAKERLGMQLTAEEENLLTELEASEERLGMRLTAEEDLQAERIASEEGMLEQELASRQQLQAAQDAAAKERLGMQLTSEEQRLADQLASQEQLQSQELQYREQFLERELQSRERLQIAQDAAARDRLGMQLSSDERMALNELQGAEDRLDAQLSSREAMQAQSLNVERELRQLDAGTRLQLGELDANVRRDIANLQVSDNERQSAIRAATDVQSMYNRSFNTISQNPNIPADVRESYLDHIMAVQDRNLGMIEGFYNVDLPWGGEGGSGEGQAA